jgi:hypothetical protein
MMWAVRVETRFLCVIIENGRVQPTTLRSILVDRASLTAMKDASPRQILEPAVPVLLDYERLFRETKAAYPDDV